MANVAIHGLLSEARAAGLKVWIENGELVIRGPRRAESLAAQLLNHKAEIIALFRIPEPLPIDVTERCFNNGCPAILEFKQGRAYCQHCGVYQRIVE